MHPYRSPPDDLVLNRPHALTCYARLPQMANDCDCDRSVRRPSAPMPPRPSPSPPPPVRASSRASDILAFLAIALFVLFFRVQDVHAPIRAVVVGSALLVVAVAGNIVHLRDRR